ncbi:hypothetical protein BH23VER1_BH23VER1_16850 [soil metagenome]
MTILPSSPPSRLLARIAFLVALLSASVPSPAPAVDAAGVTASVTPQRIGVGEEAAFTIAVLDARVIDQFPSEINAPGLDVRFIRQSTRNTYTDSQLVTHQILHYAVSASQPGSYLIPSHTLYADGTPRVTNPVRIIVDEAADGAVSFDPFVKISVPRSTIYAGEVVPITFSLYINRQTNLLRYGHPELPHDNFVIKRFERPEHEATDVDGQFYSLFNFQSSLSAIRPGKHTLGPGKLETVVAVPQSRSGPQFFAQQASRTFMLQSNSVEIEVLPLPESGRPPTFTGAVGTFAVDVKAKPTELKVGDPIALDMSVSGVGNFDAVAAPTLTDAGGWRTYPPSEILENRSLGLTPGTNHFSQIIIPEAVVDYVPSLEFSYFDTSKREYVTITTPKIPLTMIEGENPRPTAESTSFATREADAEAREPQEDMGDLLHVITEPPTAWASQRTSPFRSPGFWAAQSVPLAVLLSLFGFAIRRRPAERAARPAVDPPRTAAVVLDEIRHDSGDDRRRFYRRVAEFLDRSPDARPGLGELLTRSRFAAFSQHHESGALPAAERAEVIAALDSSLPQP